MIKKLIFYWYVPEFEWHELYDLHLKNLEYFKDCFDKKVFVLAFDDKTKGTGKVERTMQKIHNVISDATFVMYDNDAFLRESLYFYNEIAKKFNKLPNDEAIFFAHNKGVSSTYYDKSNVVCWINTMYYCCLHDMELIDKYLEEPTTCSIGSLCIRHSNPFGHFFQKYAWHYSGTFFWIVPHRINKVIELSNAQLPPNDRYFTEGFLGCVIPDDDRFRKIIFKECKPGEGRIRYFERTFSEEDKIKFKELYD